MAEITFNPATLTFFLAVRGFIGEGHDQLNDDVFSSLDGRTIYVSRPSFADLVAIDLATKQITWRAPVDGYRSDHMAISADGKRIYHASIGRVYTPIDMTEAGDANFSSAVRPMSLSPDERFLYFQLSFSTASSSTTSSRTR